MGSWDNGILFFGDVSMGCLPLINCRRLKRNRIHGCPGHGSALWTGEAESLAGTAGHVPGHVPARSRMRRDAKGEAKRVLPETTVVGLGTQEKHMYHISCICF